MLNNIAGDINGIVDDLKKLQNPNNCIKCGQKITWSEKQYKKNCPGCGSVLLRSSAMPQKEVKCWVCMDTGIASYTAQVDGLICYFGSICICSKGDEINNKDIPRVTEGLYAPSIDAIAKRNKELSKEKAE